MNGAVVNASTRFAFVVALARSRVLRLARQRTRREHPLAIYVFCDHRRYDEKEGTPKVPSRLFGSAIFGWGLGSSVLVERPRTGTGRAVTK